MMRIWVLVSSILTLMMIACERFVGIVFAIKAHVSKRYAFIARGERPPR